LRPKSKIGAGEARAGDDAERIAGEEALQSALATRPSVAVIDSRG
jgi:hypothetical protein